MAGEGLVTFLSLTTDDLGWFGSNYIYIVTRLDFSVLPTGRRSMLAESG